MKKSTKIYIIIILAVIILIIILFSMEKNKSSNQVTINNGKKAVVDGVEIQVKEIRNKMTMEGGEGGVVVINLKEGKSNEEFVLYTKDNDFENKISWGNHIFTLLDTSYIDYIELKIEKLEYDKDFILETKKPVVFNDGLMITLKETIIYSDTNETSVDLTLYKGKKEENLTLLKSKSMGESLGYKITFVDMLNNRAKLRVENNK